MPPSPPADTDPGTQESGGAVVLSISPRAAWPPPPSPLPHDAVVQLVLLLDVGMVGAGPLAAFAVVAAEDGGQLLLGQPVGGQRDGALLRQAPAVLRPQWGRGGGETHERIFNSAPPIPAKNIFFNITPLLLMYV